MAQPLAAPYCYFTDSNGLPLAGGKIYTYSAGTTSPKATYTDSGAGTPNANPVVLDSAGKASIWLVGSYKIVVKDSLGNTIHTDDSISAASSNPFSDASALVSNSSDPTKQIIIAANLLTTGSTRTLHAPDKDGTIATAADIASVGQLPGTTTNDSATAGNVGEYQAASGAFGTATVTITIASPAVITWTSHSQTGIVPVYFTTTGALPTGITASTEYWIIPSSVTANTFQIASSIANAVAGTAINTSGSQSGTQTGVAGQALTTNTAVACAALNLTGGDWDVWAVGYFNPSAGPTSLLVNASTTANATVAFGAQNQLSVSFGNAAAQIIPTQVVRVSLTTTTLVYANVLATFGSGTVNAVAALMARRRR